jgi:hypothetical protein
MELFASYVTNCVALDLIEVFYLAYVHNTTLPRNAEPCTYFLIILLYCKLSQQTPDWTLFYFKATKATRKRSLNEIMREGVNSYLRFEVPEFELHCCQPVLAGGGLGL